MTKKFADELVTKLQQSGWPATAVHGNKTQSERVSNLKAFAQGHSRVLVATDVLGRGLDIPEVTHVFVYDFHCSLQEYTHRIGRTARGLNGRGEAVVFFEYAPALPTLAKELTEYLEAMGQNVPEKLCCIAKEVASGTRTKEAWAGPGHDQAIPLAHPDEVGPWDAGGLRCWTMGEQDSYSDGWFVLCSGGHLRTHTGNGAWHLDDMKRLVVSFAGASYELQLHNRWKGKWQENFSSTACYRLAQEPSDGASLLYSALVGWVSASKASVARYKWTV